MKNRHIFFEIIIFLLSATLSYAESFTDAIQDLAMRTACIGQYSATQAGGGWDEDPHDYYTPSMIASRLAQESGNMTRTSTFYGVCFDYAQFAFNYIESNLNYFKSVGLYERQFWLAGTHENPDVIELLYPGNKSDYTVMQNGVYVKRPANNPFRSVKAHKNLRGERATHHSWIWIQRSDGIWFWIDPTWTDNLGYVVYGYVSQDGEEIQCRPNKEYCIVYPSYLDYLPSPPAYRNTIPPSTTANSTNREETIITATGHYPICDYTTHNFLSLGFYTPYESLFNNSQFGFSHSYEENLSYMSDTWHSAILMWQIDYYALNGDSALLFDINLGYQLAWNYFALGIYGGGGIGWEANGYIPLPFSNTSFAWKWTVGARLILYIISLRAELSYLNKSGYMIGMYIGFPICW